jgi:membrane-bound lytic murein transglycosylase MltF
MWGVALAALMLTLSASAQQAKPAPKRAESAPMPVVFRPWTGDWDGIVKRRTLRVVVAYSRTFYFVDKGTQRGITYEAFKGFEDDVNKRLKT